MIERRRAPRHPVHLGVRELDGQPGAGSYLHNLTELDAALETPVALAPGDAVETSFIFPGEKQATSRKGRVVWGQRFPYEKCWLFGLEFSDLLS